MAQTSTQTFVRFDYGQENRESTVFGPYEFVQLTYDALRVGVDGERELATFMEGIWCTDDGQKWSDVVIYGE